MLFLAWFDRPRKGDLQSPSRFPNKRLWKSQDFKSRFGDRSDGDFTKTRLHFMKVSVDLFRILRLVTYPKVPFPREKVIKFTQEIDNGCHLSKPS